MLFKAAIPVSNNGVLSLALCGDVLFVGSGDGKLKRLKGFETKWALEMEVPLNGSITSISSSSNFKVAYQMGFINLVLKTNI